MNEDLITQCHAYALGYNDALNRGYEATLNTVEEKFRYYYTTGYDRGITDYCIQEHLEDNQS
jgi:hypothetical protein